MVYIKRSQKIAICILLALSVLFLCVGCYFALHQRTVIVNFKMPDVEPGAIKIPASEQTQKPGQETPEGGSGGSVTYADQVTIDLSARTISFMFQNPNNSGADMVLHLFAGDQEIAATGLLKEGYEIKSLSLDPSVEMEPGEYDGSFKVDHFDPDTGEKYILDLNIDTTVVVR